MLTQHNTIFFAGLWDSWTNKGTGEVINSFTIITITANSLMASIHDRMPVILPEALEKAWLNGELNQKELKPLSSEQMGLHPVSATVGLWSWKGLS